jgi:hypothetical protein
MVSRQENPKTVIISKKKIKARKSNDSDLIKKICSKIFIIAQALHNNWFHVTSVAFFSNRN